MNKAAMVRHMAGDINHCGAIASSAIALAANRSMDIEVPLIITLMMLQKLCEKNIEVERVRPLPPEAVKLAQLAQIDLETLQSDAYEAMRELIDDFLAQASFKKVDLT